jgi:hypothetical protein
MSVVSRYMNDPRSGHLEAAHRILRYLKGTPRRGLLFKANGHLNVDGYCDADWASCPDDRRSTSGFCVFVGGNLVLEKQEATSGLSINRRSGIYSFRPQKSVRLSFSRKLSFLHWVTRKHAHALHRGKVKIMKFSLKMAQFKI